MGTRARIGLRAEDDSVVSIYTHWDGYPDHHGPILLNHYNTKVKVKELLALGDLSILGAKIGVKQDFYDHAYDGMCLAYGRDRGEKDCKALKSLSVEAFEKETNDSWGEYAYLFDGLDWWLFNEATSDWMPLVSYSKV
jgi:hypothetical protein